MKRKFAAAALVLTLVLNTLASTAGINGLKTGEVSDLYPNLFAPIGLTFSIWSVIYISLILYTLWQLGVWRSRKSKLSQKAIDELTPYYIATSLLNTAWVLAWQYRIIWLSVILIIGILLCLVKINLILKDQQLTRREYWLVRFPFSIYFGWITVAIIANITTWLVSIGWGGLGLNDEFWMMAVLVAGALIGLKNLARFREPAYILVFAWAYFGIVLKHVSKEYFNYQYPIIVALTLLLIGVFVAASYWVKNSKDIKQKKWLFW